MTISLFGARPACALGPDELPDRKTPPARRAGDHGHRPGSGNPQFALDTVDQQLGVAQGQATPGAAQLKLSGDWIDVTGSIQFDGFQQINLEAQRDIRLSDSSYAALWQGKLDTPGDLILKADHIYPTIESNFTLHSDGQVTIERSDTPSNGLIYSAGGSLTIEAASIDDSGYLAAPMGQIDLNATGRVYLAEGSVITTAGTIPINFGSLDNVFWTTTDKQTQATVNVSGPPGKSVEITGAEVITKKGSKIDVSGGGSIFSYQFQAGIQGSKDPLQGSYVIVPSGSCSLPGQAVYLEGTKV